MGLSAVGLVGLGVMGENLARNIASKGFTITVYNRTAERTRNFIESVKHLEGIRAAYSLEEFTESLERPRKIILMVQAGKAVDSVLTQLAPLLEKGDMVFDCGNTFFKDTERRQRQLKALGVELAGVGVSGGEEGALKGPSIMFGGEYATFTETRNLWETIAAKYMGEPCAGYMGGGGAGHFVKMVHNGIEYAILQLIAETYDILHTGLGKQAHEIAGIFRNWAGGENSSYLLEIAADALSVVDEETQKPLVELVLDKAEQKGTGRWTVMTAAELGVPTPSIDAAVSARNISALKEVRVKLSELYGERPVKISGDGLVEEMAHAYFCTAAVSYVQGLELIRTASNTYGYGVDLDRVAGVWRAGCIIRSAFLSTLRTAIAEAGPEGNLLASKTLRDMLTERETCWVDVLKASKDAGIPTPVMDASYNYYISHRRKRLPANIIQALRDRFGSHTYERVDRPGRFHSSWRPRDDTPKSGGEQ